MTLRDIQIQAEKMGIHPNVLKDWIKRGLIPAAHRTGFQLQTTCIHPIHIIKALKKERKRLKNNPPPKSS